VFEFWDRNNLIKNIKKYYDVQFPINLMLKDKIEIEKQNIDYQKEKEKAEWKKKYYNE
jgi:hypothetical protein